MNSNGRAKSQTKFKPLWEKSPKLLDADPKWKTATELMSMMAENNARMHQEFLMDIIYSAEGGEAECIHEMKEYVGFTESYHYCTKCNEKVKA